MAEIENKDYVHILSNMIGDSAGGIPFIGGFITAVKNTGYNIAAIKKRNRVLKFLAIWKNE